MTGLTLDNQASSEEKGPVDEDLDQELVRGLIKAVKGVTSAIGGVQFILVLLFFATCFNT